MNNQSLEASRVVLIVVSLLIVVLVFFDAQRLEPPLRTVVSLCLLDTPWQSWWLLERLVCGILQLHLHRALWHS